MGPVPYTARGAGGGAENQAAMFLPPDGADAGSASEMGKF